MLRNYDADNDGPITLRRALAMSLNVATVKVAEQTGYDRVVALWKKTKVGETSQVKPVPVGRARHHRADATGARAGLHGISEPLHAEEAARAD